MEFQHMTFRPLRFLSVTLPFLLAGVACSEGGDGDNTEASGGSDPGSGGSSADSGGGTADSGGSSMNTGGAAEGAGGSEATGPSACGSADTPFRLSAAVANNYSFTSELALSVQTVQPNTLVDLDWSALTTSFLDQPVDPTTDLAKIDVVVFDTTPEEVATKINNNDPTLDDNAIGVSYYQTAGETMANLVDFTSFGSPVPEEEFYRFVDPEERPPATTTYAMMVSTSTTIGQGVQMIQAFQLDEASTETTVTMTDSSTTLQWDADLASLTPTMVPAGQPSVMIDWSEIPTTSYGTEFVSTNISEVLIGRYELTVEELQTQFLHIDDNIASEIYRGSVSVGTSIDLGTLKDEAGNTFPGLGGEGIWLVGLLCPTCLNPTPWYVSVVEACP
jgi:hypothetical protein